MLGVMTEPDDGSGRWIDGPGFCQWLIKTRPDLIHPPSAVPPLPGRLNIHLVGDTTGRSIHRWRVGGAVDSWGRAYEDLMYKLNLSDWEVPDDIRSHQNRRPRVTNEQKATIRDLHAKGVRAVDIAQQLNISERSVRTYR
jgi:hypothetical protein